MINFIICDDNQRIREGIQVVVTNFMMRNQLTYKTYLFADYNEEFMNIINNKMSFRIYILDIETPTRSGIDIARIIRQKDLDSVIIFLTGHEELGLTVLKNELLFLSFINKFDNYEERLINSLRMALQLSKQKTILRIEDRGTIYTIKTEDILYITRDSVGRKCVIHTEFNTFKLNKSLSEIKKHLDNQFMQTHRACFVNKQRVASINKQKREIIFDNGVIIDLLSIRYKKEMV